MRESLSVIVVPTQHHRLSAKRAIEFVVELGDVDGLFPAIRITPFDHEVRVMWWMNILLHGSAMVKSIVIQQRGTSKGPELKGRNEGVQYYNLGTWPEKRNAHSTNSISPRIWTNIRRTLMTPATRNFLTRSITPLPLLG